MEEEPVPVVQLRSSRKLLRAMQVEEPVVNTYDSATKRKDKDRSSRKKNQEGDKLLFQAKVADRAFVCSDDRVDVIRVNEDE